MKHRGISAGMSSSKHFATQADLKRGYSRAGNPSDVPPKDSPARAGFRENARTGELEIFDRFEDRGFLPEPDGRPEDRNFLIDGKRGDN